MVVAAGGWYGEDVGELGKVGVGVGVGEGVDDGGGALTRRLPTRWVIVEGDVDKSEVGRDEEGEAFGKVVA